MSPEITVSIQSQLELREVVMPQVRSDTALLFVHGMSHTASFYDEMMSSFALNDGMRGMSVSLEGHGRSALQDGRSINQLTIEHYKQNVLEAIAVLSRDSQFVVPVFHSLAGRCGFELLFEGRLPEQVKGVVLLAPVPAQGEWPSALVGTTKDMLLHGRLTPLEFSWALFVSGDMEGFIKSNPARNAALFFSSDAGKENRILGGMSAETFTEKHLGAESTWAVHQILMPSFVHATKRDIPLLMIGSENDRMIGSGALRRMESRIRSKGHSAVSLIMDPSISHDMPMDVDMERVRGQISRWAGML